MLEGKDVEQEEEGRRRRDSLNSDSRTSAKVVDQLDTDFEDHRNRFETDTEDPSRFEEDPYALNHRLPWYLRMKSCIYHYFKPVFISLLLLGFFIMWVLAKLQPNSCDEMMSPPHEEMRNVGTTYCSEHLNEVDVFVTESSLQLDPSPSAVRFMVVGNFGRDGFCCQLDVAKEMDLVAKTIQPSFILNTGNAFYPRGIDSSNEKQVKTSWLDVYNGTYLRNLSWINALGDAERRGSLQAMLDLPHKYPRFILDEAYYSRWISKHVQIIVLDTYSLIRSKAKQYDTQLKWLQEELQENKTATSLIMRIVMGFHTPFIDPNLSEFLVPVLERNQVAAFFSGSERTLQYKRNDKVDYFVSGAGAQILFNESPFVTTPDFTVVDQGFLSCTVELVNNTALVLSTAMVNKIGKVETVIRSITTR